MLRFDVIAFSQGHNWHVKVCWGMKKEWSTETRPLRAWAPVCLSIYPIVLGTVWAPLCGESWAMSHGGAHPSPCQTTAKILQLGGLPWSRVLG